MDSKISKIEFFYAGREFPVELRESFIEVDKTLSNNCSCKIKSVIFYPQIYPTSAGGYYSIYVELPEKANLLMGPWEKEDCKNSWRDSWDRIPVKFIEKFRHYCGVSTITRVPNTNGDSFCYPYYSKYSSQRFTEENTKEVVIEIGCRVIEEEKKWQNLPLLFKEIICSR